MATAIATRISQLFSGLQARNRKAFIAYITAGDPSAEVTADLVLALERGGADLIELGVPFSDPIADGPVIQRASDRALRAGMSLPRLLDVVREVRRRSEIPLLLFSYLNPLLRYGFEKLARDAAEAGIDGVLLTDLCIEEAEASVQSLRRHGLDTVFLAAPTSTERRLKLVAEQSSGFIYLVSRTGVTGEQASLSEAARPLTERMRALTSLPLAVGFGISTPEQVEEVAQIADGVVVGSAIVKFIEDNANRPDLPGALEAFTTRLTAASPSVVSLTSGEKEAASRSAADLDRCREEIDRIDVGLIRMLNERTEVVEEIGRIKQELQLAIYEPKREDQVFDNVLAHNSGPLPDAAAKRIFERIIDEMRTVQKLKMQGKGQ